LASTKSITVRFPQIGKNRAVGSSVPACAEDDRPAKFLGHLGQAHDIVLELFQIPISQQLHQADLVIDQQQASVLQIQSISRTAILSVFAHLLDLFSNCGNPISRATHLGWS